MQNVLSLPTVSACCGQVKVPNWNVLLYRQLRVQHAHEHVKLSCKSKALRLTRCTSTLQQTWTASNNRGQRQRQAVTADPVSRSTPTGCSCRRPCTKSHFTYINSGRVAAVVVVGRQYVVHSPVASARKSRASDYSPAAHIVAVTVDQRVAP